MRRRERVVVGTTPVSLKAVRLVAWPSKYDDTGVMSFMISHDGTLFQTDLGPKGEAQAKAMQAFDPDSSWREVPDATP